jgi:hypothetical protein
MSDTELVLREARQRLPLRRLMTEYGHAPKEPEGWKAFTCPHCGKKKKAGVFRGRDGAELFKCFSATCPTMSQALDEVGYVAYVSRLNRKEAFKTFLKMTGVNDRRPPREQREEGPSDQELLKKAGEFAKAEGKTDCPGTDWFRQKLGIGYRRAKRLTEQWGKTGGETTARPEDPGSAPGEPGVPCGTVSVTVEPKAAPETPTGDPDELDPLPETAEEEVEAPLRALREFYAGLRLEPQDEKRLFEKRGLTSWTQQALGFRSSHGNRERLLSLGARYAAHDLVESGLWKWSKGEAVPNPQFYGLGLVGKKRGKDGEEEEQWDWAHPVLIPYFDPKGRVIGLRPHKGGAERSQFVRPRLYVARPGGTGMPKQERHERVLVAESEFKAAAWWQHLGGGAAQTGAAGEWGACALPGIQMSRNPEVMDDLLAYLESVRPRMVMVLFDNEEKGNPALPGYKPLRSKRWDTEVYARYLAFRLPKLLPGVKAVVGRLEDQWRDATGKADIDGVVARMVTGEAS